MYCEKKSDCTKPGFCCGKWYNTEYPLIDYLNQKFMICRLSTDHKTKILSVESTEERYEFKCLEMAVNLMYSLSVGMAAFLYM